nr:hypothetical protein [Escherichia coli]UFD95736.1 hypothetical protein [Escherichia coli]UWX38587.1 hypothetical protein KK467_p1395 [Klebsiella pneumoniae]
MGRGGVGLAGVRYVCGAWFWRERGPALATGGTFDFLLSARP